MILNKTMQKKILNHEGLAFSFLSTGDIHDITYDHQQINLIKGNTVDGTLLNIYCRFFKDDQMVYTKLIGSDSPSQFKLFDDHALYYGVFHGISYQVFLYVKDMSWEYRVILKSDHVVDVDLFYGQDVAIAHQSSVLSSEAYTVQYIDYKAFKETDGYTLSLRQNQGMPQYLQLGSHTHNVAYATDGFQFFGLSYKETGVPEALCNKRLPSEIYQYEFSYLVLQSDTITLGKDDGHHVFYGHYIPKRIDADIRPYQVKPIVKNVTWKNQVYIKKETFLLHASHMLSGHNLLEKEIIDLFDEMHHIEYQDQELLSFFTKRHHHVVLKKKELLVERPHGHLMIHGDLEHASKNVMATTNFMFGVFSSHLVLGNTSFNKFLGDIRNPLNLHKIAGMRIYIKYDNQYRQLGVPSYYEMGGTTTRWYYQLDDDVLVVDAFVDIKHNQQALTFRSLNKKSYDLIVSSQILMGENEYTTDISYDKIADTLIFKAPSESMIGHHYPTLKYMMASSHPFEILSEKETFGTPDQNGLLLMKYTHVNQIKIDTAATFDDAFQPIEDINYDTCDKEGTDYFRSFTVDFNLTHEKEQKTLDKLIDISFWYTHNALTHYASPHGLEQYNGAAWGTRDICQGPIEFFSAAQRFDIVREILIKVYTHQFIDNGDFPQWYMFDNYYKIQAHEAHGDIIIWPLRALAYYLKATGDQKILDEKMPFMSIKDQAFTKPYGLIEHLRYQLKAIRASFIANTHLPRYGGGDWDDTLQPANHDLTNKMVSGWTVALLYEATFELSKELESYDVALSKTYLDLAIAIKNDYEKYMVLDDIPAGFVVFNGKMTYLLHPRDQKTGLKYRLLPLTRSMISGISTKAHVSCHHDIIKTHLKHPDGVRLMDTTVDYHGGEKTYFVRAETAANFGREIGLQYVHAHIRYIEAMAKIGAGKAAYEGLLTINPILIQETVKNAYYRQSNVYFSSSDAWFKDRYEAKRDFEKIRRGDILVKGGWRLYSSGPGLYLNQLITRVLGLRIDHGDLVIDPILPEALDGLKITYHFMHKKINLTYYHGKQKILLNGQVIKTKSLDEPYRLPGLVIDQKIITAHDGTIELTVWY